MKYEKECTRCSAAFVGKGPAAKYCHECVVIRKAEVKEQQRVYVAAKRAELGLIKKPGSGKGGNPLMGKDHQNYKHGMYVFETLRHRIREEIRCCERCGKDLINVKPYNWCVHHKDHNHWNHIRTNLELLCRSCHAIEHEVGGWEHVNGATTRA